MSIVVKGLSFTYSLKTPYEKKALDNVDLTINDGDFVGIIGHTGSGKSTFIQHINGLIKPQSGEIDVFDIKLTSAKKPKPDLKRLRGTVGMVFQYPEYQLFEETVEADVAFGPKNLGLKPEEIKERVREAVTLVGLDYEEIKDRAPFDLSGGQKRRVAIAGIVAMRPKVLILDEPTAGLDPYGKEQVLNLITRLKRECTPTIIVISHDIDEITRFADRIVVFNEGGIMFDMPKDELFTHAEELRGVGLDVPKSVAIKDALAARGVTLEGAAVTEDMLLESVINAYNSIHGTKIAPAAPEILGFDGTEEGL